MILQLTEDEATTLLVSLEASIEDWVETILNPSTDLDERACANHELGVNESIKLRLQRLLDQEKAKNEIAELGDGDFD